MHLFFISASLGKKGKQSKSPGILYYSLQQAHLKHQQFKLHQVQMPVRLQWLQEGTLWQCWGAGDGTASCCSQFPLFLPPKVVNAISAGNTLRNPEWLAVLHSCTRVICLVICSDWKLVGLSPSDQGTGMGQCCQSSFQHKPHPKASICISCPHYAHAALHLVKKKCDFYQIHNYPILLILFIEKKIAMYF